MYKVIIPNYTLPATTPYGFQEEALLDSEKKLISWWVCMSDLDHETLALFLKASGESCSISLDKIRFVRLIW